MSHIPDEYRGAIAASHPELSDRPAILHQWRYREGEAGLPLQRL